jgi:hypothetical protein
MTYKRPIPSRNPPAPLNRKRPQFFPRLNIRVRPSRFPGVIGLILQTVTGNGDSRQITENLLLQL